MEECAKSRNVRISQVEVLAYVKKKRKEKKSLETKDQGNILYFYFPLYNQGAFSLNF